MYITLTALFPLINLSLTLALSPPNPTNITPPSRYYLKTHVLDDGNADKNDLYVSSYHTGPLNLLLSSPSSSFRHTNSAHPNATL